MSINSFWFLCIFALLLIFFASLQLIVKKSNGARKPQLGVLLLFSYYYIFQVDWKFCICIACVTLIAYVTSILLEKTGKKIWLYVGIISLICFLGYFKYTNFFCKQFKKHSRVGYSHAEHHPPIGYFILHFQRFGLLDRCLSWRLSG